MRQAVLKLLPEASIVIKTAAVSDYRPKSAAAQKIKRSGPMSLELEPTTDILAEISRHKHSQIIIGFAAETENALENARKKLSTKALDAIVVNDVSREGVGFDSDRNAVTIITHDEVVEVPETTKWEVAQRVLDQVVRLKKHKACRGHPSMIRAIPTMVGRRALPVQSRSDVRMTMLWEGHDSQSCRCNVK